MNAKINPQKKQLTRRLWWQSTGSAPGTDCPSICSADHRRLLASSASPTSPSHWWRQLQHPSTVQPQSCLAPPRSNHFPFCLIFRVCLTCSSDLNFFSGLRISSYLIWNFVHRDSLDFTHSWGWFCTVLRTHNLLFFFFFGNIVATNLRYTTKKNQTHFQFHVHLNLSQRFQRRDSNMHTVLHNLVHVRRTWTRNCQTTYHCTRAPSALSFTSGISY